MSKTVFQENWLNEPLFNLWLVKVPLDNTVARCKLCQKTFNLSNMGRRALTSHMKGEKHKINAKATTQSASMACFFGSSKDQCSNDKPSEPVNSSCEPPPPILPEQEVRTEPSSVIPRGIKAFALNDSVAKAEILWAIQSVMNHYSLRSTARDVILMKTMFPDSAIAQKMQLQKDKVGYLLAYGIAPFFEKELLDDISQCEFVVIGFDESLNKVAQKQQMDINVRYWCEVKKEVNTRYLSSVFLERSRAVDLLKAFTEKLSDWNIDLKKIMQISMDGPNVNFKFLNDFKDEQTDPNGPRLLDFGSCGLHTLHGAFKTAMTETGWGLVGFLRALHNLFSNSPARKALFTSITKLETFPKSFCAVRWLQNADVAQRALDLLPHLKLFVEEVEKDQKINSNSYHTIKKMINDPLLGPKLEFFKGLARDVEPFLERHQTDEPLAPFLYNELSTLLKVQMDRFVKPEAIAEAKTIIDVKFLEKNLLPAEAIVIGIATKNAISKANKNIRKIKDVEMQNFRNSCKKALLKFVSKMLEKSPLSYKLTRSISCFDPKVAANFKIAKLRMEELLCKLLEDNWVSSSTVDNVMREYQVVCNEPEVVSALKTYSPNSRLDHFWRDIIGERENLLRLLKIVCTLSHGNANVERGFSVNAECIAENMKGELLVARRCIYDKIKSIDGLENFTIEKPLILSARNAYGKYKEANDAKKKKNDELALQARNKRQAEVKLKELIRKKAKILEDAQKEADLINEEMKNLKQF